MLKKMSLDGESVHFSKQNLPILINGDERRGASLFSVSVIADLYAQGANLIFLCGYHMARDEFEEQTQSKNDSVLADGSSSQNLKDKRVIFIPSERPEIVGQVLESLDDSTNRVVFFKNFDLFEYSVFSLVKNQHKLVMMGNIDKCSYADEMLKKEWAGQLYFSAPKNVAIELPTLEKYKGYLKSTEAEGIVSIVQ